jgi:hypothetical protein
MMGTKNRIKSSGLMLLSLLGLIISIILFWNESGVAQSGLLSSSVTPNSVTLTWTAPGDDSTSGRASQYDLRYSSSTITEANWSSATQITGEPVPSTAGTVESCTVYGLSPSTTYYFAIKTADEVPNWSILSNVISRTTSVEVTPPAAIASLAASSATSVSVTLSWNAPGDDSLTGTAAQYDIRYSTSTITEANWSSATQVSGEPTPLVAGTAQTFTVTGLTPSTAYYFAIKAADEVPNWSAISNIASRSTSAETTAPSAVMTLAAISSTSSTVVLNWRAPGDDGDVGTAAQYDIRYSTSTITEANWNSATQATGEPTPLVAGTTQTFTVSGLLSSTTYYFAIKTADEVPNWSSISNIASRATSTETTAPSAITNFAAGAVTCSSIVLNWTAPGDDGSTGTATQYDIRYSTATITEANWSSATQAAGEPTPKTAGSAETYTLYGLQPNTGYYVAIKTADEVPNWSAISNIVSRTTANEAVAPAAIANLAASAATGSSITLSWTSPGDDANSGQAAQYDIRYSTSTITEANWNSATQASGETTPKVAGSSETFIVTGLTSGTVYYFAIKTADEVPNWSNLSNIANLSTLDVTPPSPILDLSAEPGENSGEILLSWTATGDDGSAGQVAQYRLKYSQNQITEELWEAIADSVNIAATLSCGYEETYTITGLTPGASYYLALKGVDDGDNCSPLSNVPTSVAQTNFALDDDDSPLEPLGPVDGNLIRSSRPTLKVSNYSTAADNQYYFEVAADSHFIATVTSSPPVLQEEGLTTSWQVTEKLEAGITYFWRVRTESSAYSTTANFSVSPKCHAYPNPFNPAENQSVRFVDLPDDADLILTSVSGAIVRQWNDVGADQLDWDGTNQSGNRVASGTYLWRVADTDMAGKIVVIQ